MTLDRYQLFGASLMSFGIAFASYSHLVLLSVPLLALGLACVILGSTLLLVPGSAVLSREIKAMVEGSLVNVEALLEEFDARGRAVYHRPNDGRVHAFIPISANPDLGAFSIAVVPNRVLIEAGGVRGVTIFPPGSEAVRLSQLPEGAEPEAALNHVLMDFLEVVESVRYVSSGVRAVVELVGPRVASGYPRVNECLGSYTVSIAGCVLAHVLRKPVEYGGEEESCGDVLGYFKVAPHG